MRSKAGKFEEYVVYDDDDNNIKWLPESSVKIGSHKSAFKSTKKD
jgi:hypothetical protein